MGIGSPENPYVENPYAGRIVNVHWKKDRDEQPPLSATALLEATGPTALPFPTGSFINDLLTTAVSGDSGVGIPGVGTLGPTRVIPGGYDYSISMSTTQVPGYAFDYPDPDQLPLGVSLSFMDSGGNFTSVITDGGGPNGETRTGTSEGHTPAGLSFAVRGVLFTDLAYARLIVTVTYTITFNPTG